MSAYTVLERLPTPDEHRALFEAVGWHPYAPQATEAALANSLFGAVVLDDHNLIGMGRVIGDGGKFFYIQDVALGFYAHYGFAAQPFGLTGMGLILPVENTGEAGR